MSRESIAQALAQAQALGGQSGEQGLESPFGQRLLQNAGIAAGGYGAGSMTANVAKVLAQQGFPALQGMGEAGAIFPEGEIPQLLNKQMASEFEEVASPTRVNYVRNNNMANFHAGNEDWPRVLADKWAMLKHFGGN